MPIPRVIFDRVRDQVDLELAELVPRIVEVVRPRQIILFGSASRGDAGEMSDIDLCIIADTQLGFFDRMAKVQELYRGRRELQVLVYTPEEWQRMLEEGRSFVRTVAAEGRVLYQMETKG